MTKTEIYRFFISRGASPYFEIIDAPRIEINDSMFGIAEIHISLNDFIYKIINNQDITVLVYSNQEFFPSMNIFRYIKINTPRKVSEKRMERLQKIKNVIDGNKK